MHTRFNFKPPRVATLRLRSVRALLCATLVCTVTGCASSGEPAPNNAGSITRCQVQHVPTLVCPSAPQPGTPESYFNQLLMSDVERIYGLPSDQLAVEIVRLSNAQDTASRIKLALMLSRTHQVADSQRALALLKEITLQSDTSDVSWSLWAQLLYPVIEEQHRTNQQLAQQAKTLRDNTRQIGDLTQKLNALRALEEDLSTRQHSIR